MIKSFVDCKINIINHNGDFPADSYWNSPQESSTWEQIGDENCKCTNRRITRMSRSELFNNRDEHLCFEMKALSSSPIAYQMYFWQCQYD